MKEGRSIIRCDNVTKLSYHVNTNNQFASDKGGTLPKQAQSHLINSRFYDKNPSWALVCKCNAVRSKFFKVVVNIKQ